MNWIRARRQQGFRDTAERPWRGERPTGRARAPRASTYSSPAWRERTEWSATTSFADEWMRTARARERLGSQRPAAPVDFTAGVLARITTQEQAPTTPPETPRALDALDAFVASAGLALREVTVEGARVVTATFLVSLGITLVSSCVATFAVPELSLLVLSALVSVYTLVSVFAHTSLLTLDGLLIGRQTILLAGVLLVCLAVVYNQGAKRFGRYVRRA